MDSDSKLMLSDDELQLVSDTGWILTKRIIIDKVDGLLSDLAEKQKAVVSQEKHWLPAEVVKSEAKIARGENYLQLPYLLLDYPRCFDAENIFAVRTMFWWGNFFSVTLHLSGKYKNAYQQKVISNAGSIKHHLFICINENQWQHHFEVDNYKRADEMTTRELLMATEEKLFLKMAIKFPLQPWAALAGLLDEAFAEMMKLLKD